MLQSFPLHPVGEKWILALDYGDGKTHSWHWTDINSNLVVTYTHSLGEEDTTYHAGQDEVVRGSRVNNKGQWEPGFLVSRGRSNSWFPWEDVIGGQGTEGGTVPDPHVNEGCLASQSDSQHRNREVNLWLGHSRYSCFAPDVKECINLGLNFRSYCTWRNQAVDRKVKKKKVTDG